MKKTLLVLGAGASKDFCRIFPTGLELIKEINYHLITQKYKEKPQYISALMNQLAEGFPKDIDRFEIIKEQLWKIQLEYEWRYLRNMNKSEDQLSIDSFIAEQVESGLLEEGDKKIIQYCIYFLIKGYEQALGEAERNYKLDKCWINLLAKKVSKYKVEDIFENLKIVTFNYDRTFERYFPKFLRKNNIELDKNQAYEFQNKVKHVYGSLGSLKDISFKLKNDNKKLRQGCKAIELINDRPKCDIEIADSDQFKEVHFIGFGYDAKNLERINLERFNPSAKFSGTAYYYKESQIIKLKEDHNIVGFDCTCGAYVENKIFI